MILGQIQTVDAGHVKDVVMVLAFILGTAGVGFGIYGTFSKRTSRIEPQPFEIKAAPQWVSKTECVTSHEHIVNRVERLESQVEEIRRSMAADKGELLQAGEERARRLHQRIDGVSEEIRQMPRHMLDLITKSKQV